MADYVSSLTGVQMDAALLDMAEHNSEAYAVGERNGIAVASDDVTYHNNARYYAQIASSQIVGDASSAVRWDTDQSEVLTDAQKAQARENINAASDSDVVKITAQTLTSAEQAQARANIMAGGSDRNLLDNPWFTVNQRGVTSGTTPANAYGLDRWKFTYGSVAGTYSVDGDGITLTGNTGGASIYQIIESNLFNFIVGKTVTLSVLLNDGTVYSGTNTVTSSGVVNFINTDDLQFRIVGSSPSAQLFVKNGYTRTIRAVKLELGSVSTLANDAPPDYGEELAKCQRYFFRWNSVGSAVPVGFGWGFQTTYARITIPTPVQMRTPLTSVSYSGSGWYLMGSAVLSVTNITYAYYTGCGVTINAYASVTQNNTYALICNASGSYIDISADL